MAERFNDFGLGFGPTEYDQQSIISIDDGGGGGFSTIGGGGISTTPVTPIPISNNPAAVGTINENKNIIVNIISNVESQILVNGENTFKITTDKIEISLQDLINSGQKRITLIKDGYLTDEEYIVKIEYNPNFNFNALNNINFGDSLIGYQNRLLPDFNSPFNNFNQPIYSLESPYKFRIEYYKNGNIQPFEFDSFSQIINIPFQLEKSTNIDVPPIIQDEISVKVIVNGVADSVLYNGLNSFTLTTNKTYTFNEIVGSEISISSSDVTQFLISKIVVTDSQGNVEEILPDVQSVSGTINSTVTLRFTAEDNLTIDIQTQEAIPTTSKPTISFVNQENVRKYNINSNTDIPIGLIKSNNVTDIALYFGEKIYKFSDLNDGLGNTIISIPANSITRIGKYRVVLIPSVRRRAIIGFETGGAGDGDPIEFTLNVVNEAYVGVPDLRDITYPSELIGPDFAGTNVDFEISYDSINTDFVRIYNSDNFVQSSKSGTVKLNVAELLKLGNQNISEDEKNIVINLKLVPYNISGFETVIGKEEFITIKFIKSDYTIPRQVAINRIASAISSQFDMNILRNGTPRFLSHLLHIGNGDNKLITNWTGSENSLILRLYEPLPTSIQENEQVWISRILSNPIIDNVRILGETSIECKPLKGPNFGLEVDNGIGFQVFNDLLSEGTHSTNLLYNKYVQDVGIDTSKLNITYASDTEYIWENFVNFGSAQERVNNFFYKLELLLRYVDRYEAISENAFSIGSVLTEDSLGDATPEIEGNEILTSEDGLSGIEYEITIAYGVDVVTERRDLISKINKLIQNFDGFEKWMYSSSDLLAYPKYTALDSKGYERIYLYSITSSEAKQWYNTILASSDYYDKYNTNYLSNNIPAYIRENSDNSDFIVFLDLIGQHFDILWVYINGLKKNNLIEEKQSKGIMDSLIEPILSSFGWNPKKAFNTNFLWEYVYGTDRDGNKLYSMPLEEANSQVWRRVLNNLPYLLKHKGTARALKAAMSCYGVPQSMLTIMEFGGPQDPTKGGTTKFTFEDRTAAIYLASGSGVKIPWKYDSDIQSYPNAVEFRIRPDKLPNTSYTLISGSEWNLDLVKTTGSFGVLKLNFGGDVAESSYIDEPFISASVSTYYFNTASIDYPFAYGPDFTTSSLGFPISLEEYSNIIINRHNYGDNTSQYEVWWGTSNGSRITTFVSMSVVTQDNQWETGSFLHIGSNAFVGNIDEVRLWSEPLSRSKFENHTLFPDAINGNQFNSSTEHLLFRLDFEYPKDRTKDSLIKNVSINQNYDEPFGYAYNTYSASSYPYQYTPYERTVTANVPSLGFNYSNKIRFETQELVTDLSHKVRATKKSYDRAPVDSNRLGLFFSPTKELNMDILKAFGDFNIDNYIGNPSDEYKETYKDLDILREYYFERLDNRNIYEYIQLVRYVDKSLFEVLTELSPARAKISKGLLIEPHYLERAKIKWTKPKSERNDFDALIDNKDNDKIELSYETKEGELDAKDITFLDVNLNNFDGTVNAENVIDLNAFAPNYQANVDYDVSNLIESDFPTYPNTGSINIECPTGASLYGEVDAFTSEVIGMDRNSLANLGFGLYAKRGNAVYRKYDDIFGNLETTGSRVSVFLVKEIKSTKKKVQTGGYPATTSGPIKFTTISTPYEKYSVSILPFSGSISLGNDIVEVTPVNGYLPTHYRFVNGLGEGLQRSYWKGSVQTTSTTPDGLSPVETFTTNPNILRVAKTGRGSGEPILEVD
jgi:hypothetical protein